MSFSSLSPRRVLIIDDNKDAADVLCAILTVLGHDAQFATNGPDGIFLAEQYHPSIIFLDIGMPGMDGFEVASALRQIPSLDRTRIVALTAWTDAATHERAKKAGFDFHLGKPAGYERIQQLISMAD